MKSTTAAINTLILILSTSCNAFAASGREDNSGILVWAFLGFCAFIVVAQTVPALLVMLGIAKGIAPQRTVAKQGAHK